MNYEIVQLEQKAVVGKSIETGNNDPKMGEAIGKLWQEFYTGEISYYGIINNKVNGNSIGLYSDYVDGKYTVTVGAEVSESVNAEFTTKIIIGGKYAKFSVYGNMVTSVAKAWCAIWATPLDRTFSGDFEEYLPCDKCNHKDSCNMKICNDCDINIYVAIK